MVIGNTAASFPPIGNQLSKTEKYIIWLIEKKVVLLQIVIIAFFNS